MSAPITPHPGHRGDPLWLLHVLQAFGIAVEELSGWQDWGNGDFTEIWGVMAHHTGANNTSADYIAHNPGIRDNNGVPRLSSQIHLSREGVATMCGVGIAWHAGIGSYPGLPTNDANRLTIGIEAQSDGTSPWPTQQLDAYYRACAAICWYLGLPASRVIAHHEWAGTSQGKWDPGVAGQPIDMAEFRRQVQHYIDNPPFITEEGLFMSLSPQRQEDLATKIDRIHHELTHEFQSRYTDADGNQSPFRETMIGYVLEGDRKIEDLTATRMTALEAKLDTLINALDGTTTTEGINVD